MIPDLVELVIAYFQYLALLLNVAESAFPGTWNTMKTGVNLSVLSEQFFQSVFPFVPSTIDARHYFLVIGVMIPLLIVSFGLLALIATRIVAWFCFMLSGLAVLAAGAIVATTAAIPDLSHGDGIILIVCGISMIVFGGFVALVYHMATKRLTSLEDDESDEDELEIEEDTDGGRRSPAMGGNQHAEELVHRRRPFSITHTIELAGSSLVFIFIALYLTGALPFLPNGVNNVLSSGAVPLGALVFIAAAATVVWLVLGLFQQGRDAQRKIGAYATKRAMRVVLVSMSWLYMPIAKSTLILLNCTAFTCPQGQRLYDQGSMVVPADLTYSLDICTPCVVGSNQTSSLVSSTRLCEGSTERRLEFSKGLACSDLETFFYPAAAIVIAGFIVVVPLLFYKLIQQTSAMMRDEIPVDPPAGSAEQRRGGAVDFSEAVPEFADEEERRWANQVDKSNHVVKRLYQPVRAKYRYWKLAETARRFLVVFFSSYVIRASVPNARIALSVTLCCHTVAAVVIGWAKPFIELTEDLVGLLLSAVLVGVAIAVLAASFQPTPNSDAFSAIAVLDVLLPFLVFAAALIYAIRKVYASQQSEDAVVRKRAAELDRAIRHEQRRMKREQRLQAEQDRRLAAESVLAGSEAGSAGSMSRPRRRSVAQFKDDEELNGSHVFDASGTFGGTGGHGDFFGRLFGGSPTKSPTAPPPIQAEPAQPTAEQQRRRSSLVVPIGGGGTSSGHVATRAASVSGIQPNPLQGRPRISSVSAIPIAIRRISTISSRGNGGAATTRGTQPPPPLATFQLPPSSSPPDQKEAGSRRSLSEGDRRVCQSPQSNRDDAAGGEEPPEVLERRARRAEGPMAAALASIAKPVSVQPQLGDTPRAAHPTPAIRQGGYGAKHVSRSSLVVDVDELEVIDATAATPAPPTERAADVARRRVEEELKKFHHDVREKAVHGTISAHEAASSVFQTEKVLERLFISEIDARINNVAHKTLSRFLLFSGLMLFVALGCTVLGLISMKSSQVVVCGWNASPFGAVRSAEAFAGYGSFANFTRHCACAEIIFPMFQQSGSGLPLSASTLALTNGSVVNRIRKLEKWVCDKGQVVERVRAVIDASLQVVDSTLTIRGMCATDFLSATCVPTAAGPFTSLSPNCTTLNVSALELTLW